MCFGIYKSYCVDYNNLFKVGFVWFFMALEEKIVVYEGEKVKLVINEDRCKGCGNCVVACPEKVLEMSFGGRDSNKKGLDYVKVERINDCIACAACAVICSDVCIEVYKK